MTGEARIWKKGQIGEVVIVAAGSIEVLGDGELRLDLENELLLGDARLGALAGLIIEEGEVRLVGRVLELGDEGREQLTRVAVGAEGGGIESLSDRCPIDALTCQVLDALLQEPTASAKAVGLVGAQQGELLGEKRAAGAAACVNVRVEAADQGINGLNDVSVRYKEFGVVFVEVEGDRVERVSGETVALSVGVIDVKRT